MITRHQFRLARQWLGHRKAPDTIKENLYGLFDSYTFREVARLVDVGALHAGRVIGDQLHRHGVNQRRDQWVNAWHLDRREAAFAGFGQPGLVGNKP
jgi:hypothetical protein